jgi:alkanesulfonate monooxygenase SsuD/methylene tetrahydromethanopterin reductase-like flavin-dependent oxidoreductase (luciferase family)
MSAVRPAGTAPVLSISSTGARFGAVGPVAGYSGKHVRFDRIWSSPKPAQRPHPPILVGGNGPTRA